MKKDYPTKFNDEKKQTTFQEWFFKNAELTERGVNSKRSHTGELSK